MRVIAGGRPGEPLACACEAGIAWNGVRLGSPLKNEDGASPVREALDHLIHRLCFCSFPFEGCDEFPPVSGMCIEQMLDLFKIGAIVWSQLRNFILTYS
jgi:hypothetical protein